MTKTVYKSMKRRTVRPTANRATAPFQGMLSRLNQASAALSAARGRR